MPISATDPELVADRGRTSLLILRGTSSPKRSPRGTRRGKGSSGLRGPLLLLSKREEREKARTSPEERGLQEATVSPHRRCVSDTTGTLALIPARQEGGMSAATAGDITQSPDAVRQAQVTSSDRQTLRGPPIRSWPHSAPDRCRWGRNHADERRGVRRWPVPAIVRCTPNELHEAVTTRSD